MTVMTAAMEAGLRACTAQALSATALQFDRAMTPTMSQPMPALSNSITFRVTTPSGEMREFTLAVTLTELTTATVAPTQGWGP